MKLIRKHFGVFMCRESMFCETMLLLNGIGFCVFGMDLVVTVINHDDFSPVEKLCVSSSLSYVENLILNGSHISKCCSRIVLPIGVCLNHIHHTTS